VRNINLTENKKNNTHCRRERTREAFELGLEQEGSGYGRMERESTGKGKQN